MSLLDTLLGTDDTDDGELETDGGVAADDGGVAAGGDASGDAAAGGRRARCRNCGQYYGAAAETCPHCGSGNKLLGGPADGTRQRR
ncbi:zinc ribbon domain-containing protein [Salinirussus salinus]|jgi:hypothetical protein|uniref:zinc ribbon domain-containing protein n=1 Tax=Salinirussus salinus TaxID=1198300 RepID=UPI001357CE66|nr:zinc ribbon domain-containing protein [Salinirussus salinus]